MIIPSYITPKLESEEPKTPCHKKISAYLELLRPAVCFSVFLMVMVGYWLSVHQFDFLNLNAILAAIATGGALGFANIHNDILDVRGDEVNYPDRPIPSGVVTLREAMVLAGGVALFNLLLAFWVSWSVFFFILFLLVLAFVYNVWLSKIPILGKVVVSSWLALTFVMGYLVAEHGDLPLIPMLTALFFILAREFIETISDDAGDKLAGRLSIYALWGKARVFADLSWIGCSVYFDAICTCF